MKPEIKKALERIANIVKNAEWPAFCEEDWDKKNEAAIAQAAEAAEEREKKEK